MTQRQHVLVLVAGLAILAGWSTEAGAQARRPQWGLLLGFTPSWTMPEAARSTLESLWGGTEMDFSGNELRVGFVRGSELGGDTGVSFVRRTLEDGSSLIAEDGNRYATGGVALTGIEIHRFAPFGTIQERVQIGLDFGAGVGVFGGRVSGTAPGGAVVQDPVLEDALAFRGSRFIPMARMEFAIAVITAPGLKLRARSGFQPPRSGALQRYGDLPVRIALTSKGALAVAVLATLVTTTFPAFAEPVEGTHLFAIEIAGTPEGLQAAAGLGGRLSSRAELFLDVIERLHFLSGPNARVEHYAETIAAFMNAWRRARRRDGTISIEAVQEDSQARDRLEELLDAAGFLLLRDSGRFFVRPDPNSGARGSARGAHRRGFPGRRSGCPDERG